MMELVQKRFYICGNSVLKKKVRNVRYQKIYEFKEKKNDSKIVTNFCHGRRNF